MNDEEIEILAEEFARSCFSYTCPEFYDCKSGFIAGAKKMREYYSSHEKMLSNIEKECSKSMKGDCNSKNYFSVVLKITNLINEWRNKRK